MAHQVVADIVGAAEADGFRRWALLRFGHAEAAFKALEAKTQDDGQLEASGLLDIARLEEAARGCGYPGPPGSVAWTRRRATITSSRHFEQLWIPWSCSSSLSVLAGPTSLQAPKPWPANTKRSSAWLDGAAPSAMQ
mmetsp:Transcript_26038/g.72787  ORF Transcript_26038/g.72787 Transcript_26038/m.72787 type:complete len:137 (+) Transcript_26038:124-534(+)